MVRAVNLDGFNKMETDVAETLRIIDQRTIGSDTSKELFAGSAADVTALQNFVAGAGNPLLTKLAKALAKTRSGVRNTRIIMVGDSTIAGNGATGVAGFPAGGQPSSPAERVAKRLRALGQTTQTSSIWGYVGGVANMTAMKAWDPRIAGTGFDYAAIVGDSFLGPFFDATAARTLTFTPTEVIDTFVIHYGTHTGSRVFSYAVDAGGATNVDGAGIANGISSVTVAAGAAGTHTLTLTKGAGGGNYIWGVEAYNSATKCVQVLAQGISGTQVSRLVGATLPNSGLNALTYFAPDLTVWNQTINEWKAGGNIDTFKTNVGAVVDAARVTGDIILLTGNPTALSDTPSVSYAPQLTYVDAVLAVAAAKGCAFIDTWRMFGSGAYENDPSIYTDLTHPGGTGGAGYDFEYDPVARMIMGVTR